MKLLFNLLFCTVTVLCHSQSAPSISITSVEVDEVAEEVLVNYSLVHDQNCSVWLKTSEDGGEFHEVPSNVTGAVGDGITPASLLSLTWSYTGMASSIADIQIKLYAGDEQEVDIQSMVDQVDTDQLLIYLQDLAIERNYQSAPENLQQVRDYLSTAFEEAELQTEDHEFIFASTTMSNILGRKPGAMDEGVTYIIDGHFDGVPSSPAADDNASAVAGMLECLRILSAYEFEHSIRFIGFDTEEYGLKGSERYVLNGIKPYETIEGVMNLEMIGYYSDEPNSQTLPFGFDLLFPEATQAIEDDEYRGNFITAVGNTSSDPLLDAFLEASMTYVPELRVISASVPGTGSIAPDLRRSDHASFWDAGIQALMLSDGADFRNLNYHTPGDIIETLDLDFMGNVVKASLATVAELALPINASFDTFDLSTVVDLDEHAHHFPAELRLFPNPSNGLLTLSISDSHQAFRARVEVYDLKGSCVHRDILSIPSGSSELRLDLSELNEGTYVMNLFTAGAVSSLSVTLEE